MAIKKITFSFPADAWGGIKDSYLDNYRDTVNQFDPETGAPTQVPNPVTEEEHAIERIIEVISAPWRQKQIQATIVSAQEQAQAQVEARTKEVREATTVQIEDVETTTPSEETA